jgi:hypothetical protein
MVTRHFAACVTPFTDHTDGQANRLVAQSAVTQWEHPLAPMYVKLALTGHADQMRVSWISATAVDPVVEVGVKNKMK